MALPLASLELRFAGGQYGLSARRLWEHTELGQVNVFNQGISSRHELNDAANFVDVVRFEGDSFWLAGFTLADLKAGKVPANSAESFGQALSALKQSPGATAFLQTVDDQVELCSRRQATRNQHHEFLPPAKSEDVFGIPFMFSTLRRRLDDMGSAKADGYQWLNTIENFQKKGLRSEELACANMLPDLIGFAEDGEQVTARELSAMCDFRDYRLSVIPVVYDAARQLRFTPSPPEKLKRTKNLPKAQAGQVRTAVQFDRVLGYRVERVEHQALWEVDQHWQAVTHDGYVIRDIANDQVLFSTEEEATSLATAHAKQSFPKRASLGRFGTYTWTGGETYREWLITVPYHPANFLSGHYKVRNVLAHVRCEIREGANGERLLLAQEVQSDWSQQARRAMRGGDFEPPFMKEWSALAMKLMLLHAAYAGLDGLAWTRGAHQVTRWRGLGEAGLIELYDRTLPREVNRMLKPFGGSCEALGVYVPTNFSIKQTENGYEVYSIEHVLLGVAPTIEDARAFVPDLGHEMLYNVHGVRLPLTMRQALLRTGFPAWG